jgi:hypothetical protein
MIGLPYFTRPIRNGKLAAGGIHAMLGTSLLRWPVAAALAAGLITGQPKPNYSGAWELTRIERSDGMKLTAGKTFKETQIWTHREPKLNLRIMVWEKDLGYRTVDLAYDTAGAAGLVGYLVHADGTKEPVNGSAHWDGNQVVYDEEIPNAKVGAPRRIIRTCILEDNGRSMIMRQVYWIAGENTKREAQWFYEKKRDTP